MTKEFGSNVARAISVTKALTMISIELTQIMARPTLISLRNLISFATQILTLAPLDRLTSSDLQSQLWYYLQLLRRSMEEDGHIFLA